MPEPFTSSWSVTTRSTFSLRRTESASSASEDSMMCIPGASRSVESDRRATQSRSTISATRSGRDAGRGEFGLRLSAASLG